MDNLTKEQRKKNMRNIKSANTKLEIIFSNALKEKRIKFRKNVKSILGRPDIVLSKERIIVFLDSCFWHKCPYHYKQPKSRLEYWVPKIERNVARDKEVNKALKFDGWKVVRFWEHSVKRDLEKCIFKLIKIMEQNS